MDEPRKLILRCPDCSSRLVIDGITGEVLFHEKAKTRPAGGKQFEELLADLEREKIQAEEVFAREVAAHEDRERLLEERFRQALARAEESADDGPPPSPFDFD
ncbi:MAG: hypothetical protein OES32_01850 [Acidobacteriota bacterium]|nr:hypothetical protein [Acidobacteriota bacterium]MDH3522303.1 hypothetical protein [Acidobacteriota bacterium]